MARVEWHDGLNIGIKKIDAQHKELVGMVNAVLDAFEKGETDKGIDNLLSRLREYTVYHFSDEEDFMRKIGFPKLSEHRQMHANLKNKVKSLQAARFHQEKVSSDDIKELISSWLLEHILRADYEIAQFVKKGGGKKWVDNIKS